MSIVDYTNVMDNTIVLYNSLLMINVPTSNSFSLETHSRTLNIMDRTRHGIPDLDMDGLDQSVAASVPSEGLSPDTEEQVHTSLAVMTALLFLTSCEPSKVLFPSLVCSILYKKIENAS